MALLTSWEPLEIPRHSFLQKLSLVAIQGRLLPSSRYKSFGALKETGGETPAAAPSCAARDQAGETHRDVTARDSHSKRIMSIM